MTYITQMSFINTSSILCPSWVGPLIKKGVLCMECKVRYFLTYYMQLAQFVFVKMPKGMTLRSQTKEVFANVYDCLEELNRYKRTQASLKQTSDATVVSCTSMKSLLIVLMMNSSSHSQSSFFVKRFFSEPQWLYS